MKSRILTYRYFVLLLFIACFAFLSSGCSSLGTYNTATQRNEFIFISTAEEVAMGNTIHQKLSNEYTIAESGEDVERVRKIGRRLAQLSDRQDYTYQFYVVEKDELNAFTIPGGSIYIFSGLLNKLTTDDQIASVLGHEIGHCAAKHTVKKYQAALGYDFLGKLILNQMSGRSQQIVNLSSGVLMNLVFSAYGRKDEYESDRLGLKYMYLAGYKLNGMTEVLQLLHQEAKGPQMPVMLKSHPHLEDRIKAVNDEIYALESQYH